MDRRIGIALMVGALSFGAAAGAHERDDDELRAAMAEARERIQEASREIFLLEDGSGAFGDRMHLLRGDRAMIGIRLADEDGGQRVDDGVLVAELTPGGPAEAAGLEAGDVIVRIDDMDLRADQDGSAERWLVEYLSQVSPGDAVSVEVRRDGASHSFDLTTESAAPRVFAFNGDAQGPGNVFEFRMDGVPGMPVHIGGRWADMELAEISEDLGRYFGTDEGLLVVRAPRDAEAGLRDGDVIITIGGRVPRSPSHAMRILNSYSGGEELSIEILRDRDRETLSMTLTEQNRMGWAPRPEHQLRFRGDGD